MIRALFGELTELHEFKFSGVAQVDAETLQTICEEAPPTLKFVVVNPASYETLFKKNSMFTQCEDFDLQKEVPHPAKNLEYTRTTLNPQILFAVAARKAPQKSS